MRTKLPVRFGVCGLVAVAMLSTLPAAASVSRIFVTGGMLIDGTGAAPRPNRGILIEGDRIVSVDRASSVPTDAVRLPADGKYVLPGLLDLRAHVTFKLPGTRAGGPRRERDPLRALPSLTPQLT
jgi:imidazolonepropionase-like amidohydrolase